MKFTHGCCILCFTLFAQSCTMVPGSARSSMANAPSIIPDGKLDFAWKLSGDRAVAPLQVFSDNTHTWLQWHPKQSVPAILAKLGDQEQVLTYKRQDPYTVIEGHWLRLSFRAGSQQAQARRLSAPVDVVSVAPEQTPVTQIATSLVSSAAPASKAYAVTAEDQHLRQALVRWSGISGWRFQPEHWSVDVDIPLSAGASFTDDFVTSVQALLLSTELSDRPLQPCFYSNQVLRVVPYAEPCDRTVVPGTPA